MEKKRRTYYVDWWSIKKSSIYGIAALLLLGLIIGGGVWWVVKSNWLFSNPQNAEIPKDAARLISFEGDVRITRAATRETEKVSKDTYLSSGDTIQTQADGKAQVRMIDGSVLSIRPDSTVVIRDSASLFGSTNVRVALDGGQINVKTEDQPDSAQNIVEVKQVENKVMSQTDASFNINQKTNGGEIRINRGGVETNANGEKTLVKDGEYVSINPSGKLSPKEKLFEPPKLIAPASLDQMLTSSSGTSDITFRWQKPESNINFTYRLEIATSPFFVADGLVIQREPLDNPSFTVANIAPGVYYWRVRGTASSGQITDWTEPWRFTVVKREGSEVLSAGDWQVENVGGTVYLISGKAAPGTIVRILGRETFAAGDGSFRLQISAPTPEVTAEISDEHGNHTRFVLSLSTGKVLRQY